jgi:hypothetical protein
VKNFLTKRTGALVVTTINDGKFLDEYRANLHQFGHLASVTVYVVTDLKTPPTLREAAERNRQQGLDVTIMDVEEQNAFLDHLGFPHQMLLLNSDHRRNAGYLAAYASGCQTVVSIDDDNYPEPNVDFWGHHQKGLDSTPVSLIDSSSQFYNICELMTYDHPGLPYARGFPYFARHEPPTINQIQPPAPLSTHINAGLWLLDPDLDAISWLVMPRKSVALSGDSVHLSARTWTPINSQNTALRGDALAAYYFIKMGFPIDGLLIDRYGDIFQGYFVQACTKALGGVVRVGTPCAQHRRNSHNFMNDARQEMACILLLEELLQWLVTEACPEGRNYPEVYGSLAHLLEDASQRFQSRFWTSSARAFIHQTVYQMKAWAQVCGKIRN